MRSLTTIALALAACTACSGVNGNGRVAATVLHQSAFCGREDPRPALTLVSEQAAFATVWRRAQAAALPRPTPPLLDFDRQLVAMVELGSRRHGGSSLAVTAGDAVVRDGAAALPVAAREPAGGTVQTSVMSAPCVIFALDRKGIDTVSALGIPAAVPAPRSP
ncbi:MAG: hypothetical protein KDH15_19610 [Rhodocyclaceae bacterium]|nr:hypothetical protein [Rhodocyclaceae bacterium]